MNSPTSCFRGALVVASIVLAVHDCPAAGEPQQPTLTQSAVIPWSDAPGTYPWGEMRKAFTGDSYGTRELFVSSFVVKPGQEVHPPHRHPHEEFMTIMEGSGVWHLDGKEIPARKGDVIYTAPWSKHGLKNTGDVPLLYFVVKFNTKGVEVPEEPEKK